MTRKKTEAPAPPETPPETPTETAAGIEVDRDALMVGLRAVADVVSSRTTIPVLANVLMVASDGVLTLTATDLDLQAQVRLPVTGAIELTADKNKLLAAVTSHKPGTLSIAKVDGRAAVTIRQKRGVRTIATLPATDFPVKPPIEGGVAFDMAATALLRLFDSCAPAISTEETRYYLNGVFLHLAAEQLRAVATDGHRLVRAHVAVPDGAAGLPDIIVPRVTVALLCKLLAKQDAIVRIAASGSTITFAWGDLSIRSKLIEGTFPDYSRVIPPEDGMRISLVRDALIEPVAAVSAVINAEGEKLKSRGVAIDLGEESTVSARDSTGAFASEPIDLELDGAPMRFGVNSAYLRQAAAIFAENATLTLRTVDPTTPIRITSDKDPDLLAVIMPMRS